MKNDTQSEKETCRIAHAIVELVERTNGPVTLVQVEREIAGFAKYEPPSWTHVITHANGETSFWSEMSESGLAALRKVTEERMVAVQFVNIVPYLFEKRLRTDEHWQPVVLLPAKAANMATPIGLMRYPEWFLNRGLAELATTGKYQARLLTPRYAGATADEFFGIGTGDELPLPRRYPTASDLASWSNLVSKAGVPSPSGIGRA